MIIKNDLICLRKKQNSCLPIRGWSVKGLIALQDVPKENAKEAIAKLKNVVLERSCLLEIMLE